MKTMGWSLSALGGAALLGVLSAAAPAGTSAQQTLPRTIREDCRCVDSAGKEIPDCTCFRAITPGDFQVRGLTLSSPRPRLGVSVSVNQDRADDAKGAKVQSVTKDGPADEGGIREGDIITSVDGKSLLEPLGGSTEKGFDLDQSVPVQRLLAIVRELKPDTQVKVSYLRDGAAHTATVTTQDLRAWTIMGAGPWFDARGLRGNMLELRQRLDSLGHRERRLHFVVSDEGGAYIGTLGTGEGSIGGLHLIKLNPGLASYFQTDASGVLVVDVDASSNTGLQPGDVILRIGDRDAESPSRVRRILGSYGADEAVDFHIVRKGKTMDMRGHIGG